MSDKKPIPPVWHLNAPKPSLNDLPKLHPRTLLVQEASAEIGLAIIEIWKRRGLTTAEVIKVLIDELAQLAVYPVRVERHGDADKKADEA